MNCRSSSFSGVVTASSVHLVRELQSLHMKMETIFVEHMYCLMLCKQTNITTRSETEVFYQNAKQKRMKAQTILKGRLSSVLARLASGSDVSCSAAA